MTINLLTKNSQPNSNQELRKQFGFEAIVILFVGGRSKDEISISN